MLSPLQTSLLTEALLVLPTLPLTHGICAALHHAHRSLIKTSLLSDHSALEAAAWDLDQVIETTYKPEETPFYYWAGPLDSTGRAWRIGALSALLADDLPAQAAIRLLIANWTSSA